MSSNEIKDRRTLCPSLVVTIIGQLWPTIEHLKEMNQTITLDKLKAHMYKKSRMTSSDCEKLVNNAIKDRLIVKTETNDRNGDQITTYAVPEKSKADDLHDWYCFVCHKPGSVLECVHCWRVFHSYCAKHTLNTNEDSFVCNVCRDLDQEIEGRIGQRVVSLAELNQLILYSYKRLVANKDFKGFINIKDQPYLNQLLYHKLDLSDIETKAKKNSYKKLIEFYNDIQNVVHCLSLLHTNEDMITGQAVQILTDCTKDLNELRDCVDCYRESNQKQDKNWFCKPCNPPHHLVFAKINRFPYWPAKVIKRIPERNESLVRFFGEFHENWTVADDNVKPIDSTLQQLKITKPSPPLTAALKELKQYQNNLQSISGPNLSVTRTPVRASSAKRPRRRADGTRPRKRQIKMEIKTERIDQNDDTNDSISGIDSVITKSSSKPYQTSTPKPLNNSPIRTRNRGMKTPFQTRPEIESPPKPRRSLQRSANRPKKSVGRPPKTPKTAVVSPKTPASIRRNKRPVNGLTGDYGNVLNKEDNDHNSLAKRLKTSVEDNNSRPSLARSRPIRQLKPNSRFKSPEIEVKIPRRRSGMRTLVKSEPNDSNQTNGQNEYDFNDDSNSNHIISNQLIENKLQVKGRRRIANKSQTATTVVAQLAVESPERVTQNGPKQTNPSTSNAIPVISPRRGRPKGVKNKSTIEKMRLEAMKASKRSPSPPRKRQSLAKGLSVTSPDCSVCRTKWEKVIKNLKESLETEYKEMTKKLKKDLEAVKQLNYRLQNENYTLKNNGSGNEDIDKLKEKHLEEMSEIKKKQWCAVCQNESIYYCCWNTSYCSVECQQQHWHIGHKKNCKRALRK